MDQQLTLDQFMDYEHDLCKEELLPHMRIWISVSDAIRLSILPKKEIAIWIRSKMAMKNAAVWESAYDGIHIKRTYRRYTWEQCATVLVDAVKSGEWGEHEEEIQKS